MKRFYTLTITALLLTGSTCVSASLIEMDDRGRLQAELNNVKLEEISQFVADTYGVSFKGDLSSLQTPVTISFKNLDLERMLKRVLGQINHVIAYNRQGDVIEVKLLSGGGQGTFQSRTLTTGKPSRNAIISDTDGFGNIFNPDGTTALGVYPNSYNFNATGVIAQAPVKDEISSFTVDPDAKDEVTSFEPDKDDKKDPIASFKVDPNAPKDPITSEKVLENTAPPEPKD